MRHEVEPEIYTLAGCPVIGELGDATRTAPTPGCDACELRPPPVFTFIEYRFDRWAGEDLVGTRRCYVASERLRRALEAAGTTGLRFEPIMVSKGDDFEIVLPAYQSDMPHFERLVVTGTAIGPEVWWRSSVCGVCGLKVWERTAIGRKAETAHLSGAVGPPREVYRDSWQGQDAFNLEDPGPPLVTKKFVEVIKRLGVIGVHLHPALWIDRA